MVSFMINEVVFQKKTIGISQLIIPFENIYTSVFLVDTLSDKILVDCGTKSSDVDDFIIPSLKKLEIDLADISFLVLTHKHGDHVGGLERIVSINPKIKVIDSLLEFCANVEVYNLTGHTNDCIGLLELSTGTLLTGDGLQGEGVGMYKCYLENFDGYRETLKRILSDKRIENVVLSHAYNPWETDTFTDRKSVKQLINDCVKIAEKYN